MSAFTLAMDQTDTRVNGENGAKELRTTGSALVNLFFKCVRDTSDETMKTLFEEARAEAKSAEAIVDLFVLAFQTRACREGPGKGERRQAYTLISLLGDAYGDELVLKVLPLFPLYGYYKDLLNICALKPATAVADKCLELMAEQLKVDEAECAKAKAEGRTPSISLAGKYAPREGSAFDKQLKLATKLALKMFGGANKPAAQRKYRRMCSSLNQALATPEVLMCSRRYAELNFKKVASLCLQRHRKAFLNEALKGKALTVAEEVTGNRFPTDEDRVAARAHLRAALVSKKGVKGAQLQPHELAKKLMAGHGSRLSTVELDLMEAQWAAMRASVVDGLRKAQEAREEAVVDANAPAAGLDGSLAELKAALPRSVDLGKLVPLIDVSGSMSGQPMEVAIGLGILVSELASPAFKDRALTFESTPSWVDLSSCKGIADKVRKVQSAGWGGSTDFEAACEQILGTAQRAKLKPDEIPDLIVFSDMQFNEAGCLGGHGCGYYGRRANGGGSWETHYERLSRRFAEVGVDVCGQPYAAPRIIFWNLRGQTRGSRGAACGFPVQADAPNTQMLAGFSPALLKLVLTGAPLVVEEEEVKLPDGSVKTVRAGPTPEQTVRAALDDAAFDPVRSKLAELTSGPLASYTFVKEELGFEVVAEGGGGVVGMEVANSEDFEVVDCA